MKKIERILMMVVTLLLCGTTLLHAEAVSPEQAKQTAARFMAARNQQSSAQGTPRRAVKQSEMETSVIFDAADQAGQPYLYAVRLSEQGGYVLVSGDDRFTDVLGYIGDNTFDEQDMPDNMRAWLQGYIDEMAQLEANDYQPAIRRGAGTKSAISPLISTMWGQDEPFNNQCPSPCVTGCVATAMAQVINYHMQNHNAPTRIKAGIAAYTTTTYGFNIAAVAAGTNLPGKSLLINSYKDGAGTTDQRNAVAQLMSYCGASVKMDYSPRASEASSSMVPQALISNFGFDATTRSIDRTDFVYSKWMDTIYNELAASRPVMYSGASSGGGHAFIVDGYDGDGLFHINWGWEGFEDSYFALSALNPDDDGQTGASSSSDGYTMRQAAIIGIQINTGQTYNQPICLTTSIISVNNTNHTFNYKAYNYTGETHSFNFGVGFWENGTIIPIDYSTISDLSNNFGPKDPASPDLTNTSNANKTKKIIPISRENGTTTWYPGANPDIYYVEAKYDANGVPTLTMHPKFQLTGSDITIPTGKYVDEEQIIKLSVTNTGDEFYGNLYLFASTTSTKGTAVSKLGLTALAGSTNKISMLWTPTAAGTYNLWIATDDKGTNVIATHSVTITEETALAGKTLIITAFSFSGQDKDSYQVDASGIRSMDVYGDALTGTVSVKNISSGTLSNIKVQLRVEKYNESTGKYETDYPGVYTLTISAGKSINLSVNRSGLATNKTYRIALTEYNTNPTNYLDDRYVIHLRSTGKPEATITSAPQAKTLTYNGSAQALVTAGSAEGGEMQYKLNDGAWSSSVPSAKAAGTYTVYYKVVADADHTDNAGSSVSVTISKAMLTVTAANKSVTYGAAAPTYSGTITGFKNSETASVLTTQPTYTCSYTAGNNAGSYTITASGAAAANYNFTYNSGILTVNAKSVTNPTITLGSYDATYSGIAKQPTVTVKDGGTTISSGEYNVVYNNNINVGTASITITDKSGGNYTVSGSTNFTISKAMLTVTAANKTVTYGEAAPTYSGTITGFKNSETASVLTTQPTYTCSYTAGNNAGSYTITASGAADDNYDFTYNPGTLTVNKAQATLTAPTPKTGLVQDDNAHELLETYGSANGGELQYKVNDGAWTTSVPSATAAGSYTVYYRVVGDANHLDNAGASFVVSIAEPAPIITALDQTPFPSGEGRGEALKIIKDNQILILRDGKTYTITGQEVK